jgi:hypothetical protein
VAATARARTYYRLREKFSKQQPVGWKFFKLVSNYSNLLFEKFGLNLHNFPRSGNYIIAYARNFLNSSLSAGNFSNWSQIIQRYGFEKFELNLMNFPAQAGSL